MDPVDSNRPLSARIDRYFGVTAAGSSLRREVGGGLTTYLAMAYILFVQPTMLGAAGMDPGAVLSATCISAALATLVMGLWARYPVGHCTLTMTSCLASSFCSWSWSISARTALITLSPAGASGTVLDSVTEAPT